MMAEGQAEAARVNLSIRLERLGELAVVGFFSLFFVSQSPHQAREAQ
jgi:hypothetical protein